MQDTFTVDRRQIPMPEVKFTDLAMSQLSLILENDFTLKGKYFRLLISGKGCDGFTYSVGFTDWNDEDLLVPIKDQSGSNTKDLQVVMDPFAAFYLQKCSVDYIQDFANNNEGFLIKNENQKVYAGKFWRQDETKIPPLN
jgi:Fe-S cluster assembly iron-binding protein IscA